MQLKANLQNKLMLCLTGVSNYMFLSTKPLYLIENYRV